MRTTQRTEPATIVVTVRVRSGLGAACLLIAGCEGGSGLSGTDINALTVGITSPQGLELDLGPADRRLRVRHVDLDNDDVVDSTTTFAYDDKGRVLSATTEYFATTRQSTYEDADGNLVTEQIEVPAFTTIIFYEYAAGRLVSKVKGNEVTSYRYENGELAELIEPYEDPATFRHEDGRLVHFTDPYNVQSESGVVPFPDEKGVDVIYANGLPVQLDWRNGVFSIYYEHDANGRFVAEEYRHAEGGVYRQGVRIRDEHGRVTRIEYGESAFVSTELEYEDGRLTRIVNTHEQVNESPSRMIEQISYSADGLVMRVVDTRLELSDGEITSVAAISYEYESPGCARQIASDPRWELMLQKIHSGIFRCGRKQSTSMVPLFMAFCDCEQGLQ